MARYSLQRQQKIGGVNEIAQNLKSYVNSLCQGRSIGVGYFIKGGKCINNPINMFYIILNLHKMGLTFVYLL